MSDERVMMELTVSYRTIAYVLYCGCTYCSTELHTYLQLTVLQYRYRYWYVLVLYESSLLFRSRQKTQNRKKVLSLSSSIIACYHTTTIITMLLFHRVSVSRRVCRVIVLCDWMALAVVRAWYRVSCRQLSLFVVTVRRNRAHGSHGELSHGSS